MAQTVKNLPAMWETWVRSLGWEDPLEEGMATDCNIIAWRMSMNRGAWWATGHGVAKSQKQLSDEASIVLCIHRTHFVYLFPCRWTLGMLPSFGHCI